MEFKVTNMTCPACESSIHNGLDKINVKCKTTLDPRVVKIISNPENKSEDEIIKAISNLGFAVSK